MKGESLSVVVGGLGLGYTAVAALKDQRIDELLVADALEQEIGWHSDELVPLSKILNADPRNRYVLGSFFELATDLMTGFDAEHPGKVFDAILLDIDHSPSEYLNPANACFYTTENLSWMAQQLKPEGVFAMWPQNLPDPDFGALLMAVFIRVESHVISFYNPFQSGESTNSVYVRVK